MTDQETLALQVLVPLCTAVAVYLFLKLTKRDLFAGGCASTVVSFAIVATVAIATFGITSTLPIGLAISAGFAFVISELFFAAARRIERRRSN